MGESDETSDHSGRLRRAGRLVRRRPVRLRRPGRPLDPGRLVRGQYRGYTEEAGVKPGSRTETYAALELHLDSWRWQDVPFYIRAGKCLAATVTEVMVEFRRPPRIFDEPQPRQRNYVRFRLGPHRVLIALGARTKAPGTVMAGRDVELSVCDFEAGERDAYERLLRDALKGDATLFARWDGIEAAWRVVDPVLNLDTPVYPYEPGSWGPPAADRIVGPDGWRAPVDPECI